ncbi:acyl carrier protein [Kitasatospora sp. NPDC028055]|uniref:acyl carrier protein n=1 Tax=unclassified Kitasatospora TaxID=2633591 RepID=UPI0033E4B0AE
MTNQTAAGEALLARMTDLLCDRLGLLPEEVTSDARLREDLGMDSLDLVELVTIMEEHLGGTVDDEVALSLTTVGEVIAHVVDAERPGALA